MGLDLRDVGAVALSFLCIAAVETVSASDVKAVQHETGAAANLSIAATETVSSSETKANSLTDYRSLSIAGIDTASLSDAVQERIASLLIARREKLTANDSAQAKIASLRVLATENVTANDSKTVEIAPFSIAPLTIAKQDTATVSDSNAETIPAFSIEALTIAKLDTLAVSDGQSENIPAFSIEALAISKADTVTASDTPTPAIALFSIAPLEIAKSDTVTGNESSSLVIGVDVTPLSVSKTDSSVILDLATLEIPAFSIEPLTIAALDTVAVNDSVSLLVESETSPKSIYAIETVSGNDSSSQTLAELIIQASDSVYLAETQNEMLEYLNIQMSEVITASESSSIHVGSVAGPVVPRIKRGLLMGVYP